MTSRRIWIAAGAAGALCLGIAGLVRSTPEAGRPGGGTAAPAVEDEEPSPAESPQASAPPPAREPEASRAPAAPGAPSAAAGEPTAHRLPPAPRGRHGRHHGGMRRDLSGAPPEALGAQLLAGLNGFRPRIEECARGAPRGEGSQAGDGSRAQDASRTESADPGKLILALVTQGGLSEGKLNDEGRRLLGELQAATTGPGASRGTLLLDVETLDGTVRVVDVDPDRNGSTDDLLVGCARKELREQLIPVPAARAGHRVPVVYTLDPAGAQARPR